MNSEQWMAFWPFIFIQGMAAGWAFRAFNGDPRLRATKDWMLFLVWGVIVCNIIGAAWGSTVLRSFGLISPSSHLTVFLGWMLGNSIPSFVLGVILLKYLSPLVIKSKTFCKRWFA
ncbi:MAG: hypothetical protein AB1420_10360 [Bacillota bacterium]